MALSSGPGVHFRHLFTFSLFALLLAARPGTGGGASPEPRWIAGALCEKGETPTETARGESGGVSFEATPVAPAVWEARLERRTEGMGSALRRHDGSNGPFQVFLLTLRNNSPEILRFQPGNIVRLLGDTDQDHILDFTDLYRYLLEEGKNPDSLEGIRDTFFDTGFALQRGESVERLLFFKPLPAKGKKKRLTLLFSSFQVGTETHQAALSWHAEKEKK